MGLRPFCGKGKALLGYELGLEWFAELAAGLCGQCIVKLTMRPKVGYVVS